MKLTTHSPSPFSLFFLISSPPSSSIAQDPDISLPSLSAAVASSSTVDVPCRRGLDAALDKLRRHRSRTPSSATAFPHSFPPSAYGSPCCHRCCFRLQHRRHRAFAFVHHRTPPSSSTTATAPFPLCRPAPSSLFPLSPLSPSFLADGDSNPVAKLQGTPPPSVSSSYWLR